MVICDSVTEVGRWPELRGRKRKLNAVNSIGAAIRAFVGYARTTSPLKLHGRDIFA
jgi:hypothetical protein